MKDNKIYYIIGIILLVIIGAKTGIIPSPFSLMDEEFVEEELPISSFVSKDGEQSNLFSLFAIVSCTPDVGYTQCGEYEGIKLHTNRPPTDDLGNSIFDSPGFAGIFRIRNINFDYKCEGANTAHGFKSLSGSFDWDCDASGCFCTNPECTTESLPALEGTFTTGNVGDASVEKMYVACGNTGAGIGNGYMGIIPWNKSLIDVECIFDNNCGAGEICLDDNTCGPNLCIGVTCDDYCSGDTRFYDAGCESTTGNCNYQSEVCTDGCLIRPTDGSAICVSDCVEIHDTGGNVIYRSNVIDASYDSSSWIVNDRDGDGTIETSEKWGWTQTRLSGCQTFWDTFTTTGTTPDGHIIKQQFDNTIWVFTNELNRDTCEGLTTTAPATSDADTTPTPNPSCTVFGSSNDYDTCTVPSDCSSTYCNDGICTPNPPNPRPLRITLSNPSGTSNVDANVKITSISSSNSYLNGKIQNIVNDEQTIFKGNQYTWVTSDVDLSALPDGTYNINLNIHAESTGIQISLSDDFIASGSFTVLGGVGV